MNNVCSLCVKAFTNWTDYHLHLSLECKHKDIKHTELMDHEKKRRIVERVERRLAKYIIS